MSKVQIELKLIYNFLKSDGDCSPCHVCKEPIYGKMQTLTLFMGEETRSTDIKLCEPCYELVSEK